MIGLMGVGNDGTTLYLPNGTRLCGVPSWMAWKIQKMQHWLAQKTWK
jgi:hypothetical protein